MTDRIQLDLIPELLGLLTHDLRNPLSAVHSNLSYLASTLREDDVDAREALEDAMISSEGLSHLIDNVEVLAQVISGHKEYEKANVPLTRVVSQAVDSCRGLAKSYEVTLEVAPGLAESPIVVFSHKDMLIKGLECLIRNAVQHSPPEHTVSIDADTAGARCIIRILDDGHALTAENQALAFSAKGQLSGKGSVGGRYSRGLGLLCAGFCSESAGAVVSAGKAPAPHSNAFQLEVPLAK